MEFHGDMQEKQIAAREFFIVEILSLTNHFILLDYDPFASIAFYRLPFMAENDLSNSC